MCASSSTENCSVNWLKTRHSPGRAGFKHANSTHRTVSRISRYPRVCPPLPYTVKWMPHGGLRAEAIEHRSEDLIVIEAVDERFIQRHFLGHGSVHHALVEIGGAQPPDLAREHDVVAVMHLGEVVEGAGLLRKRQHVLAAVMFDSDVAFFDIDIGSAVFSHGPEFDQVAIGPELPQREQQVEGPDHVVDLGKYRMFAVDHRIRSGPLLGKVHHGVRRKRSDHRGNELIVGNIAGQEFDVLAGDLFPGAKPFGHRPDRASTSARPARDPTGAAQSCRQWRPDGLSSKDTGR